MKPIEPTTDISVMLTAQEWNSLMDLINRYGAIVSIITGFPNNSPLLQKIGVQLKQSAEAMQVARPNGAEGEMIQRTYTADA